MLMNLLAEQNLKEGIDCSYTWPGSYEVGISSTDSGVLARRNNLISMSGPAYHAHETRTSVGVYSHHC